MANLTSIAKLPEVKSAVLSDCAGTFLESLKEADGESVAAVTAFLKGALSQAGEHLGLGALRRVTFTGQVRACLVVIHGNSVLTAFLEPATAAAAVEKALDASLQGRG